ncbi:alpha/beta hydrolase [Mycolicibacterium setense]|uniref:alpha/beta hydrolase n=1 Tax=Mycolicibacterium setense TaxID=431269 RepID=UPI000AF5AD84|nr:alpha/beta hydrolase [Mycolicibacterium setense]
MSALDGFYSTWSKARATFGEGTPSDGSHYDGSSSQLLRMKGMIESAAPDDRWQGTGSEAYAAANQEHAGVYAKLAELDKKMAAEVTNAANVVTSGRNQLSATKSWVDSMVASLPATTAQDRENKLIPIANQGISQVNTTVQNANRDMFAIGTRVTGIKGEYDGLTNQKFGPGEKTPTGLEGEGNPSDPPQRVPEDPEEFREFWEKLSPEERNRLYEQDHRIGNHPGMPFGGDETDPGKNYFNSKHLAELQELKQAEVNQLQSRVDELMRKVYMGDKSTATGSELASAAEALRESRHTLDGYNAVQSTLDKNDGTQRYLGFLDDQGHASVSIGNPDNASRSAIFVPGTGQDMAAFDGSDNKSLKMYQAALAADPNLKPGDVSVTTWMGYDRPMDLIEAADPEYAANGGSALDTFMDGMHASHNGPPAIDTVIGHSYGSTLVGGAATGDGHLAADNVVAVGSPGMLTPHASDLNLEPNANVYSMTAENDVIQFATDMTLGSDPFATEYGATRLAAAPGPTWGPDLPSVPAHSSYWDRGNPALDNLGAVIAGLPPTQLAPPEIRR